MKILVLCDHGNNRSVTIAHHIKYWGHDVLTAGVKTNTPETITHLIDWAERIIITEVGQLPSDTPNMQLWDVGPDVYPRPFNPQLLKRVRALMEEHKPEYKS